MEARKCNGLAATNNQPAKDFKNAASDFIPLPPSIGDFPIRHNTVTAEVLARLVVGENLTSLDSVKSSSTTRLSATIFYLGVKYNWTIARADMDVGTADGRIAVVTVYYLDRAVIHKSLIAGALDFNQAVKDARARTRKNAPRAKAQAAKRNAARANAKLYMNQGSLSSGVGT